MKLIIAKPSPYARKARVALIEKAIEFETIVENPWLPDTGIADVNPLGKIPALVLDDGRVIHDSKVIIEYLETLNLPPALLPSLPDLRITHKQIEVIADGISDAIVLIRLEGTRPVAMQSSDWVRRQRKKNRSECSGAVSLAGRAGVVHCRRVRAWGCGDRLCAWFSRLPFPRV